MYKHLDKRIEKQYAYILIIQQKVCQINILLKMNELAILGGVLLCANSHVLCAIPHSQHNVNVKI